MQPAGQESYNWRPRLASSKAGESLQSRGSPKPLGAASGIMASVGLKIEGGYLSTNNQCCGICRCRSNTLLASKSRKASSTTNCAACGYRGMRAGRHPSGEFAQSRRQSTGAPWRGRLTHPRSGYHAADEGCARNILHDVEFPEGLETTSGNPVLKYHHKFATAHAGQGRQKLARSVVASGRVRREDPRHHPTAVDQGSRRAEVSRREILSTVSFVQVSVQYGRKVNTTRLTITS